MPDRLHYRLRLTGAALLISPDSNRIDITSKKSIALLGLLATAHSGERWRAWIQDKLWGSRELRQAQASLRRELHALRKLTMDCQVPLFIANSRTVRLNLANVNVDIRQQSYSSTSVGEFLEGIDIAGEESFEEWLRETRSNISELSSTLAIERDLGHVPSAIGDSGMTLSQ